MDLKKDPVKAKIVKETIAAAQRFKPLEHNWFEAYFMARDESANHEEATEVANEYMENRE